MMTNEQLQSKTIAFLRFPLIVGVVLIHAHFTEVVCNGTDLMREGGFPLYYDVSYFFSEILARISVPLFFVISGFLFFYRSDSFQFKDYGQKLKKRAKTILVPYIFWNLLVIGLFFLSQTFIPGMMSGSIMLVKDFTFADWMWAFWNADMIGGAKPVGEFPICFQLWFIRDLMVAMLLSPLLYFLVKKLRLFALACLGLLWFFGVSSHVVGLSIVALFFFSIGAFFSVHGRNFVCAVKPFLPVSMLVFFALAFVELVFREYSWAVYVHRANILAGIVFAVSLSAYLVGKRQWNANAFLADSSFFVYAYHALPLVLVIKLSFKMFHPQSSMEMLGIYFVSTAFVIAAGLIAYYLLKRYLPRFTAIITGGR